MSSLRPRMLRVMFGAALLMAAIGVSAPAQSTGRLIVRNATVWTVTSGVLERTDILIEDGIITRLGRNLETSPDVALLDASGAHVIPGLVDIHAHVWEEPAAPSGPLAGPALRVADAIDPADPLLIRAAASGITVMHVVHGSARPLGPRGAVIKLRLGEDGPSALVVDGAEATLEMSAFRVPEAGLPGSPLALERSRLRTAYALRSALDRGRDYRAARAGDSQSRGPLDPELESVSAALSGAVRLFLTFRSADEFALAFRLLEERGSPRIVMMPSGETWLVDRALAQLHLPLALPASAFGGSHGAAVTSWVAGRDLSAGAEVSIGSGGLPGRVSLLGAAARVRDDGGLSDDAALSLVTLLPARTLGIADRVGSIELGKDGDLVLLSAHPLSPGARVLATVVEGIVRVRVSDETEEPAAVGDAGPGAGMDPCLRDG